MKRNILPVIFISVLFAFSILLNFKLTVGLLFIVVYFINLKNEQVIIMFYFFIYLCLTKIANYFSVGYGAKSINFLGVLNGMLILSFYFKLGKIFHIKKEYWNKILIYPIFLFMLCLLLTIPFSRYPEYSIKGLNRTFSVFAFYFLTYYISINNKNMLEKIFYLFAIILYLFSICGILEYFTKFNVFDQKAISYVVYKSGAIAINSFDRIRTAFAHPAIYAFAILTFLPLNIYYANKHKNNIYIIGIGLLFINLILTFIRISWIAVTIQLILSFYLFGFRFKKIFVFGFLLIPISIVFFNQVINRLTVDNAAAGRIEFFLYGLDLFKSRPLFGNGLETFQALSLSRFGTEYNAHGDYMRMFAETGILGGISYLVLLFSILIFTLKNIKNNDFAKVAFLTLIGFMVFSLTDNGLAYSHILWGLLGIYNGIIVRDNSQKITNLHKFVF